jgi:hypothetical protein
MAKEPEKKKAAVTVTREHPRGTGTPTVLRDRFQIYPATPLYEYDLTSAQAFACDDKREPARLLMAYVCRPEIPSRNNLMRTLKGASIPGLLPLIEWGVIDWPPLGRQCMVVVYQRPLGGRVLPSMTSEIQPAEEHELVKEIVPQLLAGVRGLKALSISHRAIRPNNLYYMDEERTTLVLGDCVTSPPAFEQPLAFETIESGMCWPAGRGEGGISEDLYALGATVTMLRAGRNNLAEADDVAILRAKITRGSYPVLVGEERMPLSMIELLRGLLCDDPQERWGLDDVDLWSSGRRLSPLQPKQERRAVRAFAFADGEYSTCRELSFAFAAHFDKAAGPILDGSLDVWLRRGIEDKDLADKVAAAVKPVLVYPPADRRGMEEVLVARVCMLLDSQAPIRYKGFSALPSGFGNALAVILGTKSEPRVFAECMLRDIPSVWVETRPSYDPSNNLIGSTFSDLKAFLQQTAMGYGLERVLYDLNELLPCQSPLVADQFVVDIAELLPALDQAAKKVDPKSWPIDRHIVAFIACRMGREIERQITAVNDKHIEQSTLGMVSLLAMVQWKQGPESLPSLAGWIGGLLGPIIQGFHGRIRRREMEKDIPRLIRSGSLPELFNYIDNAEERVRDKEGFQNAQTEYASAAGEARAIETGEDKRGEQAMRIGHQAAGVISMMVAMTVFVILLLLRLL